MTDHADSPLIASPPGATSSISVAVCWIIILGIVGFMLVSHTRSQHAAERMAATSQSNQVSFALEVTSRVVVGQAERLSHKKENADPNDVGTVRLRRQLLAQVDRMAKTPAEKLDAVCVAAELQGASVAFDRLKALQPTLANHSELLADAGVLRTIYTKGPGAVDTAASDAFAERRGWFGRLALCYGLSVGNPQRIQVIGSAVSAAVDSATVGMVALVLFVIGFLLLALAIVLFALGHLRFAYQPVARGGPPVFLQTFALWLVVFTALSLMAKYLAPGMKLGTREAILLVISLTIALFPLMRGMNWPELRLNLGWHMGRGIVQEVVMGLLGYIAGLPILGVGLLITLILMAHTHQQPTHPLVYQIGRGGTLNVIGLYLVACVGAPILEETMFRGALYHHLRRRWRPWWAAVVVSVLFAAIHPQGWTAIPVLACVALILAALREWRGSLLAPMAAHATNNAIVLSIMLYLLR